ncbi:MAG: hypothetical protein NWS48_09295 [Akkermansiaceae bacterium]|nr:hypothetical protein [Akkermansiaceae bacterium]MDP4779050.1 hypothetical protein [Akkermansiaceae bacterium]
MKNRILSSYPARFLFLAAAIVAALLIVNYRVLILRDFHLLSANR